MPTRSELLEAHTELTCTIRASEEWEPSYKRAPKQLKALIQKEAELQASVAGYLLGLRDRVPALVNWSEVELKPLQASQVPPLSDELWATERQLLQLATAVYLTELTSIGIEAGEIIYSIPLGIGPLDQAVIDAAGKQTARLVKQVTKTTRGLIQTAIKQAILEGDDVFRTIARIQKLVANPVRAEMIAQTESVTAYQSGLEHFAAESGAVSSTWDALSGACQLCAPLDGKTAKLGESFVLGNGVAVPYPPGHPRCRCGRILNY